MQGFILTKWRYSARAVFHFKQGVVSSFQLMQQLTSRAGVHLKSLVVDLDVNKPLSGGSG